MSVNESVKNANRPYTPHTVSKVRKLRLTIADIFRFNCEIILIVISLFNR